MANFSRVNPLGWAIYEKLLAAQMNQLDINMTLAVNGQGSTHTPLEDIVLKGPFGLRLEDSQLKYEDDRVVPRRQPMNGAIFDSGEWEWSVNGVQLRQGSTADSGAWLRLYLTNLPDGGKLTSVTVSWDGPSGHSADPILGPGPPPFLIDLPRLEVYRAAQDGTVYSLGVAIDNVVTRALYQESHEITVTCGDHVIDLVNNAYYIRFRGEYDPSPPFGDFLPFGLLEAIKTSCKVSAQSEY